MHNLKAQEFNTSSQLGGVKTTCVLKQNQTSLFTAAYTASDKSPVKIRVRRYTSIFGNFRYLRQTSVTSHNIVIPHMLEITCDIISTFSCVVKMGDSTEAISEEMAIVPKKKVVSPGWDHFWQHVDSEGKVLGSDTAMCCRFHCNIRANSGNTSNLLSHLRVHHLTQYTQVLQMQKAKVKESEKGSCVSSSSQGEASIPELFNKAQKYNRTSRRLHEITDSITYCISKDILPIYTTEKDGFRRLIETLDPRYDIPFAKCMSGTAIPALYEKIREQVASDTKNAKYVFCCHNRYVVKLYHGALSKLFYSFH